MQCTLCSLYSSPQCAQDAREARVRLPSPLRSLRPPAPSPNEAPLSLLTSHPRLLVRPMLSQPGSIPARLHAALRAIHASKPRLIASPPPSSVKGGSGGQKRASVAISESLYLSLRTMRPIEPFAEPGAGEVAPTKVVSLMAAWRGCRVDQAARAQALTRSCAHSHPPATRAPAALVDPVVVAARRLPHLALSPSPALAAPLAASSSRSRAIGVVLIRYRPRRRAATRRPRPARGLLQRALGQQPDDGRRGPLHQARDQAHRVRPLELSRSASRSR